MNIERHPFEPFLPQNSKILMLGSFPPAPQRWAMHFYYPNFINDMWRIFGFIFFDNKEYFVDKENKTFKKELIINFLKNKGIALYDTVSVANRTTGTAADKDLEVIEATDITSLLQKIDKCKAIITTGEKATEVVMLQFNITQKPKVGEFVCFNTQQKQMKLYRMPSSSRAYPMKIEQKAEYYKKMFTDIFNS